MTLTVEIYMNSSWSDVSTYVKSLTIRRGRQQETARYEAGSASVVLLNTDGRFSPSNLSGPYVSSGVSGILPWVPIRIKGTYSAVAYGIFYGWITSWQETYGDQGGKTNEVTISCVDEFSRLARFDGEDGQDFVGGGESSGSRIDRILTAAGSTASTNLAAGVVAMQETDLSQNALAEIHVTADSEGGAVWVDGDGVIQFESRYALLENSRSNTVQTVFSDRDVWNSYLDLPGSSGNSATTPDSSLVQVGTKLDVRLCIAPDDWTPTTTQWLIGQWTTTGNQRGWALGLTTTSQLIFEVSTNGTSSAGTLSSSALAGVVNGSPACVRVTWDSTASPSPLVTFWQKPSSSTQRAADDLASDFGWVQVSSGGVGAFSSIFNSTTTLMIGQIGGSTARYIGNVYASAIYRGVTSASSLMFEADFTEQPSGTTSFTNTLGQTITINTSGSPTAVITGTQVDRQNYTNAIITFTGDHLANILSYSAFDGEPQTVSDSTSRALYGDMKLTRTDLMCETDAQVLGLAQWDLQRRKDVEQRIEQITIFPQRSASVAWPISLGREIRDLVKVIRHPPGGTKIVRYCFIGGVSHSWSAEQNLWRTTFNLDSATAYLAFAVSLWDVGLWDTALWFY